MSAVIFGAGCLLTAALFCFFLGQSLPAAILCGLGGAWLGCVLGRDS